MDSAWPEDAAVVLTKGVDGVMVWSGRRLESSWPVMETARSTLLIAGATKVALEYI